MELVVKAIIFNIKVFVSHSDRALRTPPCSNDVTYLKMTSGLVRRCANLLFLKGTLAPKTALESAKVVSMYALVLT